MFKFKLSTELLLLQWLHVFISQQIFAFNFVFFFLSFNIFERLFILAIKIFYSCSCMSCCCSFCESQECICNCVCVTNSIQQKYIRNFPLQAVPLLLQLLLLLLLTISSGSGNSNSTDESFKCKVIHDETSLAG